VLDGELTFQLGDEVFTRGAGELAYRARRDATIAALAERLPEVRHHGAAAGLHLHVALPAGADERAVALIAEGRGVLIEEAARPGRTRRGPRRRSCSATGRSASPRSAAGSASWPRPSGPREAQQRDRALAAGAQPLGPRRPGGGHLGGRRRAGRGEVQAVARGSTETSALALAPRASSRATPASTTSSWPSTPRSSDAHGKLIVIECASPCSAYGGCSAAATANSALGSAPRRAARRDASARPAAFASTPMTSVSGRTAAAASTARPSPVPRSMATRANRAASASI
jgi:hypothetical protein